MKTRISIGLAIAGAAILGAGWALGPGSLPSTSNAVAPGTLVFPGMAARLPQAARIEITTKGETLHISRTGDTWGLADRDGFRLQGDKLRELLTGLTELRITEPRTSDAAQYAKLGVDDPQAKETTATLLRLLDGSGSPLASLIIGHRRVRTAGNVPETLYIRRPGETQSWLAEGRLPVDADPQLWFDRDIANIGKDKIAGVTVHRSETDLVFGLADGKPALLSPAEHPKLDDYKVEDVFRGLETLTLTDVKKAASIPGEKLGTAEIRLADGAEVTVTVHRDGKDVWAIFTAKGDSVKDMAQRAAGWAFQLGSWKEQSFVPTMDDLKASEPEPAAKPTQ
jgi:hypothetical protein